MKKILFILCCLVFLCSCGNPQDSSQKNSFTANTSNSSTESPTNSLLGAWFIRDETREGYLFHFYEDNTLDFFLLEDESFYGQYSGSYNAKELSFTFEGELETFSYVFSNNILTIEALGELQRVNTTGSALSGTWDLFLKDYSVSDFSSFNDKHSHDPSVYEMILYHDNTFCWRAYNDRELNGSYAIVHDGTTLVFSADGDEGFYRYTLIADGLMVLYDDSYNPIICIRR